MHESAGDRDLDLLTVNQLEHPASLLFVRDLSDKVPRHGPGAPVLGDEAGPIDPLAVLCHVLVGGVASGRDIRGV